MPVHFEFGRHLTEEDAVRRLGEHFKPGSLTRPDFVVWEYNGPHDEKLALSKLKKQWKKHARKIVRRSSEGILPSVAVFEEARFFPQVIPYARARAKLLVAANQREPRIKAFFEPFSGKARTARRRLEEVQKKLLLHASVGNLEKAFPAFVEAYEAEVENHVQREKAVTSLLEGLHKKNPGAKILVEFGAFHSRLAELVRKKGIPTTYRILREKKAEEDAKEWLENSFQNRLFLAKHGLTKMPSAEEKNDGYRRAFLDYVIARALEKTPAKEVSSAGYETEAHAKIKELTPKELEQAFDNLAKPGGNLGWKAFAWLVQNKGLRIPGMELEGPEITPRGF